MQNNTCDDAILRQNLMNLTIVTTVSKRVQKLVYPTKYLIIYWTDLCKIFRISRRMDGNNPTIIILQSPKEQCYGKQLTAGPNIEDLQVPASSLL